MSSEGVKLPALSPTSSSGGDSTPASTTSNRVVALPPLIPPPDLHHFSATSSSIVSSATESDVFVPQAPSPTPVFLTALSEDTELDGPDSSAQDVSPERKERKTSVHWHAPVAAKRVGSYIRDLKYNIHMRMCSKCRMEGEIPKEPQDRTFGGGGEFVSPVRHGDGGGPGGGSGGGGVGGSGVGGSGGGRVARGGGGGRVGGRSGRDGSTDGGGRSRGVGKKCSSLCVHLTVSAGGGGPGEARVGGRDGVSSRDALSGVKGRRSKSRRSYTAVGDRWKPSEVPGPGQPDVVTISIYHKLEWEQMTWEQLLALLMTNFAKGKELSKQRIKQLQELKQKIIRAIEEGHIPKRDPRLVWENRQMLLVLQMTKLSRTRDIYQAVEETLEQHNAELRRLATLFEVRAYRKVHEMKVDFLKNGCTLMRFTSIPGRMCRGINLYQACLAVVYGRRWSIRVMERQQKRARDQTEAVTAEIEKILKYKFQELPADKMRVAHLLKQMDDQLRRFEDGKQETTDTVDTMYSELEERRQREVHAAIAETMDSCVDEQHEWAALYDFNTCLSGLCRDMAKRNAMLRRQIAETKQAERNKAAAEQEWRTWILQQRTPAEAGDGQLSIRRKTWLPV